MTRFFRHVFRAVRIAATDRRIPRCLRWLVGLGLLPIPGPVDESILLVAAIPLAIFYRQPLREAWQQARDEVGRIQHELVTSRWSDAASARGGRRWSARSPR